jgi:branched-chain amino acid transport system substrate-binding protein
VKLVNYFLVSCLILSFFSCTLNPENEQKVLKIARNEGYKNLIDELINNFKKNSAYEVETTVLAPDKALTKLLDGKIDIYIGNIDFPSDLSNLINEILLCKDGLLIVTHPNNPINNLNKTDLIKIFTRNIKNWKTFTGLDQPIIVIDREENSPERKNLLKSLFSSNSLDLPFTITVKNHEELVKTITKFPNAISYMNYSADKDNLRTININNISPSKSNITEGYFPLTREIYVYFNKNQVGKSKRESMLQDFLDYLYSSEGQSIVSSQDLVPLSPAELELMKLSHNPISIGVAAPMEGPYTDLGRSIVNAAKLAIDEKNLENGIKGRALKLIVCNDRANTKLAIDCANRFVENKVWGVIGHLTSKESIEASKIYREHKIPLISPGSTHPWLTERPSSHGFVFRTTGRDDQQAKLIYKIIRGLNTPNKKVSIFHNDTVYGSNAASLIEYELKKNQTVQDIVIQTFKQSQSNFQKEIKEMNSNILVFIGEYADAAKIAKELALSNKKDMVFICTDGIFSKKFIELAGLRAEGTYVIGSTVDSNSELLNDFEIKYKSKFGTEITAYTLNSYDSTKILLEALEKSDIELNKYTPELIAKSISNINYQGITGEIKFNSIGDIEKPRMAIYRVINAKFVKE